MTFSEGNYGFFPLKFLMKIFPVRSKEKQQKIAILQKGPLWKGEFQGPETYLSLSGRSSGKDQSGL